MTRCTRKLSPFIASYCFALHRIAPRCSTMEEAISQEESNEEYWSALLNKYHLGITAQEFLKNLQITVAHQGRISQTQQRSTDWFDQRQHRLTASNFGAALGHSPYERPMQVIKKMLWPQRQARTFVAQQWGIDHEDQAVGIYRTFMQKQVHADFHVAHQGLYVSQKYFFLGGSPDGVVIDPSLPVGQQRGLLEIKCPFKKTFYPEIPLFYYDQIMGVMGLMDLRFADFVVWTPEETQIRRFAFDPVYFAQMIQQLETLYFTEYMPRYLMKQAHLLKEGELDAVLQIAACPTLDSAASVADAMDTSEDSATSATTASVGRST